MEEDLPPSCLYRVKDAILIIWQIYFLGKEGESGRFGYQEPLSGPHLTHQAETLRIESLGLWRTYG
mgnify:CR=1 FL=1